MAKTASTPLSKSVIQKLLEEFIESAARLRLESLRESKSGPNGSPDFVATLRDVLRKRETWKILIEAKSRGEPFFLANAADQLRQALSNPRSTDKRSTRSKRVAGVVVAPYISDVGARVLRERNTNYLDLAGNGRLSVGTILIEKTGRTGAPREENRAARLFQGKSQVILRALLNDPARQWTISSLSADTKLSLGYTHAIVRKLAQETFVTTAKPRGIRVSRPAELLDAWANARRVSDDSTVRLFSFERSLPNLERQIQAVSTALSIPYALTLGAGADLLAPQARLSEVQMYVRREDVESWIKDLNLRRTDAGANVTLRVAPDDSVFYGRREVSGLSVVCPPQLYVDLFNWPARGREQADALRERVLRF